MPLAASTLISSLIISYLEISVKSNGEQYSGSSGDSPAFCSWVYSSTHLPACPYVANSPQIASVSLFFTMYFIFFLFRWLVMRCIRS